MRAQARHYDDAISTEIGKRCAADATLKQLACGSPHRRSLFVRRTIDPGQVFNTYAVFFELLTRF
jgi:hypothetical protein